jgi:hypothetical protein
LLSCKALQMDEGAKLSREERLAAKLRENLRRRKTQAREIAQETGAGTLPKLEDES